MVRRISRFSPRSWAWCLLNMPAGTGVNAARQPSRDRSIEEESRGLARTQRVVRHRPQHQLDADLRHRGRAISGCHDRGHGRVPGEVGDLRRALQDVLSRVRAHPAREGRRRLFGEGGAGAQSDVRRCRSRLAVDPQGPLRRHRPGRVRGDERRGAHGALRPGAGHAQHGHVRHARREPPRPDAAVLPARALLEGPAVRLGAQGLPLERVGCHRRAPYLRRPVHGPQRHRHRRDADLRLRDRLHQHAVPRPGRRRRRSGRLHLLQPDLEHPDRRVASCPDRWPGAAGADQQWPQGGGAEAGGRRPLPAPGDSSAC